MTIWELFPNSTAKLRLSPAVRVTWATIWPCALAEAARDCCGHEQVSRLLKSSSRSDRTRRLTALGCHFQLTNR